MIVTAVVVLRIMRPRNGRLHPLAAVPILEDIIPFGIVAGLSVGLVLILAVERRLDRWIYLPGTAGRTGDGLLAPLVAFGDMSGAPVFSLTAYKYRATISISTDTMPTIQPTGPLALEPHIVGRFPFG